ncbi:heme lyase CcmF/NrfE family subunit [Candidatus Collinsella stercoripullorum]|uniref:heme lyase CcmF/NrfE family subunit n=1 Tax=Candidatus Collinsella stercoripullorum TaxID=2838522 RepID=UPI0022E47187|nr:cytochrome c biogenesis protein CcsA [Candidatus Collinsella stercoripullorum]
MVSMLGSALQVLALVLAAVAAVVLVAGVKLRRERLVNAGYLLVFAVALLLTGCIALILACMFTEDYSIAYVVSNYPATDSPLKPLYLVSAVWAGRQGSLLLWTWLISLYGAAVAWRRMRATDDLSSVALGVTEVVVALFAATLVLSESNNPFLPTAAEYLNADGSLVAPMGGMNPLLMHWAMILHPPATFIGYAGATLPFAYALAALICGDTSSRWVELSDRIAVFAFIFLTVGMALGAVWAYVVLGWGGFWAWDAVENASLFSWLAAVALVHSFTMYRKRGCFKRWSMLAATATFIFVVLGTFITRSGLVQSVHAFAEDPVSTYFFLGIMIAAALSFLALLVYRNGMIDDADEIESIASKSGSYFLTNLVCLVGACLVAYLTVSSALPTWMPLGGQAVPAGAYNAVARPMTALFGLLMAVCPLLGWRRTDKAAFARNFRVPALVGAVAFAVLMAFFALRLVPDYEGIMAAGGDAAEALAEQGPPWYYFALTVVSFLAAAMLLATSSYLLGRGVRGRMRGHGEGAARAVVNLFRRSPAQAGGYLAHLGCAVALIGLVGSGMYVHEQTVDLPTEVGASAQVGDYVIVYRDSEEYFDAADNDVMTVLLEVGRAGAGDGEGVAGTAMSADDQWLADVETSMRVSAATRQQTLDASVTSFPLEDLFIAFQGVNADGTLSISVKINPLIMFTWVGAGICIAGIALAFLPRRATPLLAADERAGGAAATARAGASHAAAGMDAASGEGEGVRG